MLARRKPFLKKKTPLTLKQSIGLTMVIHLAGLGAILYWPVVNNKLQSVLSVSATTKIKQPAAPYSDALERAFLTLKDWSKTDKQLAGLSEKQTQYHTDLKSIQR